MPDDPIIKAASEENRERSMQMARLQGEMRTAELMLAVADELTGLRHEMTAIRQLLAKLAAEMLRKRSG